MADDSQLSYIQEKLGSKVLERYARRAMIS